MSLNSCKKSLLYNLHHCWWTIIIATIDRSLHQTVFQLNSRDSAIKIKLLSANFLWPISRTLQVYLSLISVDKMEWLHQCLISVLLTSQWLCDCTRELAISGWCWLEERHSSEKDNWKDYLFQFSMNSYCNKKRYYLLFCNESAYSDKFMEAIVPSGTGWFDIDHTFLWLLAVNISCTAELFFFSLSLSI